MFGRPPRDTGLESERNNRPSAEQRLHLLNSSHILRKIEQSRMIQYQTQSNKTSREMASGMYLGILSRYPTEAEMQTVERYFQSSAVAERQAAVDLAWACSTARNFFTGIDGLNMNTPSNSDGISRREAIRRGVLGATGLMAGESVRFLRLAAAPPAKAKPSSKSGCGAARAPRHVRSEPEAGNDYAARSPSPSKPTCPASEFAKCCRAGQAGRQVFHHPQHEHGVNAHETRLTSFRPDGCLANRLVFRPSAPWFRCFKGYDAGYKGLIRLTSC